MTKRRVFVEMIVNEDLPTGDSGALVTRDDDLTLIARDIPENAIPVSLLSKDSRQGILATLVTQWKILPASEKAAKISELKHRGFTHRKIAEAIGVGEQDISFYSRLQYSDPRISKALDENRVSPSAVEPLLSLSLFEQEELVPAALQKRTVRGIKALVTAHQITKSTVTGNGKSEINEEIDPTAQLALDFLREADNILQNVFPGMATWTPGTQKEFFKRLESLQNSVTILRRDFPDDGTE